MSYSTMNHTESKELTEAEIEEINAIVSKLQTHISVMQDEMKKRNFSIALSEITEAIKSTSCPLCKEKLALLSTQIIQSKVACDSDKSKCSLLIKRTIDKAEEIKSDFIPIATEKRYIKEKSKLPKTLESAPEIISEPSFEPLDNIINALTMPLRILFP